MSNFEDLLRKSLEERKSKPMPAVNDLNAIVAEVSAAVASVTKDRLRLFLDPLKPKDSRGPAFAIVLRLADEDRALRVVEFNKDGYPAMVWPSYHDWDLVRNVNDTVPVLDESHLRNLLQGFVSSPDSILVRLIANELAVAEAGSEAALAG